MSLSDKNITIIGLGLMGGALATALRDQEPQSIAGYDINEEILEEALTQGVIDFGIDEEKDLKSYLSNSDYVFLCIYPKDIIEFLKKNMAYFKSGATITDIAGIKQPILKEITPCLRADINYIPGHPMAGKEKEGFGAADSKIFYNSNYILVPLDSSDEKAVEDLTEIIRKMGFTNIVRSTPEEHDRKIAYTSQLCHVIASALVDSEDDLKITDFEGGSYGELTRIAMINAPMWTEIFLENKEFLVEQIEEFEESLRKIKLYIEEENNQGLLEVLSDVRQKRVVMEINRQNKHIHE